MFCTVTVTDTKSPVLYESGFTVTVASRAAGLLTPMKFEKTVFEAIGLELLPSLPVAESWKLRLQGEAPEPLLLTEPV